jgi:hypothetical protein
MAATAAADDWQRHQILHWLCVLSCKPQQQQVLLLAAAAAAAAAAQ